MKGSHLYRLFVYGSLRSGFKSPAYEYISRYFRFVCDAKVKGKLYDLGEYCAGITSDDDGFIIGELYEIKDEGEFSWAIAQLDDYEGIHVESDEMQLYRREIADAHHENETTSAWIYWYNGDVANKPVVSSGDILDYLKNK